MRRILMLAAVVVAVVALVGAALVPAGAGRGSPGPTMIVVRKTVQGPATGGFAVLISCVGGLAFQSTLNFDAAGTPTTFSAGAWSIVDGSWKLNTGIPNNPIDCTVTETDADGAPTTTWTCDYVFELVNGDTPDIGCDAPSGTGTGPVSFTLGEMEQQVVMQVATVHFTNTVPEAAPAAAVPAAPTFTG